MKIRYSTVKRGLDIVCSAGGLIATAPIQLGIAAAVRITMGSPVLYRQQRPGKDAKLFELLKFRSMKDLINPNVTDAERAATDEQRLTKLGRFLRSTSLDELPSLINVLRGDMSIVGPRPLLVSYLELYNETQARRHEVRPGITGLAQVNGRNHLAWPKRFELDVFYVDNLSFKLDLEILWKTVVTVLGRQGITSDSEEVPIDFLGNEPD